MRILIETVPHNKNRNNQVGDYRYLEDGTLHITVSDMGDERFESLVALHEFIEERLTKWAGISEEDITKYDYEYECRRQNNEVPLYSENGFGKDCIYKKQHMVATGVEMIIASEANIDWNEYEQKINEL